MARPIRETPVLKGDDAYNFELNRIKVDNMSKEERAENWKKVKEGYNRFLSYVDICI